MRHKFTKAECSRGGKTLVETHGREHMVNIGKQGWQNVLSALATRQNIPIDYKGGNPFRNLLRNLKAAK
jgi:general stress protein YciG